MSDKAKPTGTSVTDWLLSLVLPGVKTAAATKHGTRSLFSTLEEFWTVWRAINWITAHRQYMTLGVVLAEYATKTALSCLPPKDCERCEQMLGAMGVNVRNVGLTTLGETALSVALTGAPVCGGARREEDDALLQWLMSEARVDMRTVATLPPPEAPCWAALHAAYALALRRRTPDPETMMAEAQRIYGPRAWRWVRGGLHSLRQTSSPEDVARAFARWHAFCVGNAHFLLDDDDGLL